MTWLDCDFHAALESKQLLARGIRNHRLLTVLEQSSPPLLHYLHVVRREAWLILAVVAISVGTAAFVSSYVQQPVYRASMKIVVGQGGGVFQPQYGAQVQPSRQTMTNLLQSDIVASTVIDNLQLKTTPRKLLSDLASLRKPRVRCWSSLTIHPARNRLSSFSARSDRCSPPWSTSGWGTVLRGPSHARPPSCPSPRASSIPRISNPQRSSPRPKRTVLIAGILGLVIGLVLAFARDALDERIRGRRDAEDSFGAPVIGELPKERSRGIFAPRGRQAPRDPAVVEALYRLRANLQFSQGGIGGPVLVVTSAVVDDSHSIVAANVAVTLARAGADVIIVEADMRRPHLERALNVATGSLGLVDVLERGVDLDAVLESVPSGCRLSRESKRCGARTGTRSPNGARDTAALARSVPGSLRLLSAGKVPPNPADVLTQARTVDLLDRLRTRAQYIVIDTPPLLRFGDAFPVLSHADNVVVVARDGEVTRSIADSVRTTLGGLGVQKFSIVLTHSDVASLGSAYRQITDISLADEVVPEPAPSTRLPV